MKKNFTVILLFSLFFLGILALVLFNPNWFKPAENVMVDQQQMNITELAKIKKDSEISANNLLKITVLGVIIIQLAVLFAAMRVIGNIRKREEPADLKLKRLETAETYLDLPLYVGLFGTVASFIIISLNPQASRLVAYSSTLIGIIISINLRIFLYIPLRQRLLSEVYIPSISSTVSEASTGK